MLTYIRQFSSHFAAILVLVVINLRFFNAILVSISASTGLFFSQVISLWNSLPSSLVCSSNSVLVFKRSSRPFLASNGYL